MAELDDIDAFLRQHEALRAPRSPADPMYVSTPSDSLSWADRAAESAQADGSAYQSGQGLRGMVEASPGSDLAAGFGGAGGTFKTNWTGDMIDAVRQGIAKGMRPSELAKGMGLQKNDVANMMRREGIDPLPKPIINWDSDMLSALHQMHAEKVPIDRMAERIGVGSTTLKAKMKELGLGGNPTTRRPRAYRLTPVDHDPFKAGPAWTLPINEITDQYKNGPDWMPQLLAKETRSKNVSDRRLHSMSTGREHLDPWHKYDAFDQKIHNDTMMEAYRVNNAPATTLDPLAIAAGYNDIEKRKP